MSESSEHTSLGVKTLPSGPSAAEVAEMKATAFQFMQVVAELERILHGGVSSEKPPHIVCYEVSKIITMLRAQRDHAIRQSTEDEGRYYAAATRALNAEAERDALRTRMQQLNDVLTRAQQFAANVHITSDDKDEWHMHRMQALVIRNWIHEARTGERVDGGGDIIDVPCLAKATCILKGGHAGPCREA